MKGTVHSTFAMNPSKADKKKFAALWPLELNDLVIHTLTWNFVLTFEFVQAFEVDLYLKALQCDVEGKRTITGLHIAQYILWPEVSSTWTNMCDTISYVVLNITGNGSYYQWEISHQSWHCHGNI